MNQKINIPIILIGTQKPENLGSVSRAMANCWFHELRLVSPEADYRDQKSIATSMGGFNHINVNEYKNLNEATSELQILYATTNRERTMTMDYLSLENATAEIVKNYLEGTNIGLVFGPEQSGLDNESVMRCTKVITIELNKDFCSLNLAQAVLLTIYQIFTRIKDNKYINRAKSNKKDIAALDYINALRNLLKSLVSEEPKIHIMLDVLYHYFIRSEMSMMEIKSLFGVVKDIVRNNGH